MYPEVQFDAGDVVHDRHEVLVAPSVEPRGRSGSWPTENEDNERNGSKPFTISDLSKNPKNEPNMAIFLFFLQLTREKSPLS